MEKKNPENWLISKYCGKGFPCNSKLVRHIRGHTDERPFICKTCRKPFNQTTHLKRHIVSAHGQETLSQCDYCQKSFINEDDLKEHKKSHTITGDKPHICGYCEKGFTKAELKTHTVTYR